MAMPPLPPSTEATANRAFCMAAWVHLAVAANGVATPCCEAKGDFGRVGRQSLDEIWRGGEFRAFRAKLRRGERDDRCGKCYDIEQSGGTSFRQGFNAEFADRQDRVALDLPPAPVSLDIRFSNLCNFSCRMCWHGSSSKWFADARALGWKAGESALIAAWPGKDDGLRALQPLLAGVEKIYWAGGEPLLMEEHYAVLEALLAAGRSDVKLKYNSNLSELRAGKFDILSLWPKFESVVLEVSVDGTDRRGELIRHGLSWPGLRDNIAQVRAKCPKVRLEFGVTVSVFNIFALTELHRTLAALGDGGAQGFRVHALQEPAHYNIQILPKHMKRRAAKQLLDYAQKLPEGGAGAGAGMVPIRKQFEAVVEYMMQADRQDLIGSFRSVSAKLDRLRGEDTVAICPELAPLLRPSGLDRWRLRAGLLARRVARKLGAAAAAGG